jgi:hypothetical protein
MYSNIPLFLLWIHEATIMPKWAQEGSEKYLISASCWFMSFFPQCHVNYDLKLQPHCSTQLFELVYQPDAALSAVYSDFHGEHIEHYLVTCSAISDWIKSHPNSGTFLCASSSISGKI